MTSTTVTIRAKTLHRGMADTTVLVHSTGEMHVKVYSSHEGVCFVSAARAQLSPHAKRKAWAKAGFRRGER